MANATSADCGCSAGGMLGSAASPLRSVGLPPLRDVCNFIGGNSGSGLNGIQRRICCAMQMFGIVRAKAPQRIVTAIIHACM